MRSFRVLETLALFTWIPIDICNGTDCSSGKFGWQCRYDCLCEGPCNTRTGECQNCTGLSWGPGCLLSSSCTYNDGDGRHYQGKRGFGDYGGRCITWDPAVTGYPAERFPDADLRKAGGYCRNPANPEGRPWCYTSQERYFEWCTINPCPCPSGRFGVNCASQCHCSDDENTCDSGTGVCQHGCHPDFQGASCQKCRDKRFGKFCEPCHCLDPGEVCDKTTGYCQSGCSAGWTGDSCGIACESGRYGMNCTGMCSRHCVDPGVCNRETGSCICQAGYQPPTCHKTCESGRYGLNCSGTCSFHCEVSGFCNKETGTCTCQSGYQPPTCHNEYRNGLDNVARIIASTFGALSAVLLILFIVLLVIKHRRSCPPKPEPAGEGNPHATLSAWSTTESEHETQLTAPNVNVSDASDPGPIYI